MAFKFAKSSGGAASSAGAATLSKPKQEPAAKPSGGGGVSFLKRGNAAKQEQTKVEAAAEMRKAEQGKLWRFWMPDGADRRITFLDGDLDSDGMLDINMLYEHGVRLNGNIENFVCTADIDQTQPCPICEKGEYNSFVGVLTIIDHTEHTIKKGAKAGQKVKNTKKLFVAKQATLKQLTKLAQKRGGLAGCTFDVSRTGDREPGVGNQFDFHEKYDSYEEMAQAFGMNVEDLQPANYEEELRYRTPEELVELGVGKAASKSGFGYEKGVSSNLKDEL